MSDVKQITIRATVDLDITWCSEDFEESEMSWQQFINKIKRDKQFAKETFMRNVYDFSVEELTNLKKARISVIEERGE